MSVKAVVFDTENVFWEGFSREICLDPQKPVDDVVRTLKNNQLVTEGQITRLRRRLKKYGVVALNVIGLIGDVASVPSLGPYSVKECKEDRQKMSKRIAAITQAFAKGMEIGQICKIADGIALTENIEEVIGKLREENVYQIASSNGVAPFVYAVVRRLGGVDYVEVPETTVIIDGEKRIFTPEILEVKNAKIDPELKGPYNRLEGIRKALIKLKVSPSEVLHVESCEPDFEEIRRVKNSGGYVIAFRPNDNDLRRVYEMSGVPMLDTIGKQDAGIIYEIAKDPKMNIGKYCV